jgi:oligopeptide/dipeptide ABC transporter ATP-binding protein
VQASYVGRIVELAETEDIFTAPKHPYTAALLSAVPEPDPRVRSRRIILQGELANPASPPSGCYFHPRCPHAIEVCRMQAPAWQEIAPARFVACHRAQEQPAATVGSLGSLDGPLVGTALFFLAREFLSAYGSRHMILLGTLAVGVMLAYPQGLRGIVADRRDLRFFPVQRRVRLERN